MKRTIKFIALLAALFVMTGCATTSHFVVANGANVSHANFRVIRHVQKQIVATKFIIFGGGNKQEEMERAIEEMSKDLGPNQALAFINIVESYTIPIFPIITTEECTINATVIEFTDSAVTIQHTE